MAVRNKYCTICDRSKKEADKSQDETEVPNNEETQVATDHKCTKNWTGSSTSMEADILVEGFCRSEEMYGVRYGRLIADGDSSVYSSILAKRPYSNMTVEKIECRNHLHRNFCEKLKTISQDTSLKDVRLRRNLEGKILKFRRAVASAVKYRKSQEDITFNEALALLKKDIANVPYHIFGHHANCADYFCSGAKDNEKNLIPDLERVGILARINKDITRLIDNARSLLIDVDSNAAEQFNADVAKTAGGKRVNFSLKGSYGARSYAAVVVHNTRRPLYKLHKTLYKRSPGKYTKAMELSRLNRLKRQRMANVVRRRRTKKTKAPSQLADKDYGPNASKPDMEEELFKIRSQDFLDSLKKSSEERHHLERSTLTQSDSGQWKEERRKLLTASNFGVVCNRRPTTSCKNLVKAMLYSDFDTEAMRYGRTNEDTAVHELETTEGVSVSRCGLFIDSDKPYLGASPDGLIDDDGLVEVKCPSSAKEMTPNDAIAARKITFWSYDKARAKVTGVNVRHKYHYQVQGQLHVTKRNYCLFAVWTPLGIKVQRIERDDNFWHKEMLEKLTKFYMDCLLPELVDPRHTRSMEIRDPPYITEAIRTLSIKKKKKKEIDIAATHS